MLKQWWQYEWAVAKRAWHEIKLTTFLSWSFFIGLGAYGGQWLSGLKSEHETELYIVIGVCSTAIGLCCAFFYKLFALPSKMAVEAQEKYNLTVKSHNQNIQELTDKFNELEAKLNNVTERASVTH